MVEASMMTPSAPPPAALAPLHGARIGIEERPLGSLVQLAWWPGARERLDARLAEGGYPPTPERGGSNACGDTLALDGGPGRALLVGPADLFARLAPLVDAGVGTVTDLSHSRVRIALEGPRARTVLEKGTSVDLRNRAFPVGAVAWTAIHSMGIVLHHREAEAYDVLVYRGFARALNEWLRDAARPDGL